MKRNIKIQFITEKDFIRTIIFAEKFLFYMSISYAYYKN